MKSMYAYDKFCEECFSCWLDEHFYNNENIFSSDVINIIRIDDVFLQKKGIDVEIDTQSLTYKLDEKAALHYVNKNISTFAFELLNRTSRVKGWLYNSNYETTHYVLCWPNANLPIKSKDSFTWSEIMVIERNALIHYLDSMGLTYENIKKAIEEYLPLVTMDNYQFELVSGIRLFFTEKLREKPVNLVISKTILSSLACYHKKIE